VKSLLIDTTLKISEDFSNYDLIIAEERICTKDFMQSLEPSNTLVCLSNLFGPTHHLDLLPDTITLKQPLTQKHLEECFKNIYSQKAQEQNTSAEKLKIYKNTFADAKDVTLHQFAQFRGSSILLVEDNFINQKVVLGILSKSGIAITIANNGQEALDILNSDATFQLVLMDINMPIMDGYTAAKQIRRNVKYNTLPIIALSALTSKLEVESMFASGMNGFLAKPLKKEKLFSALSMFVSEKKEERRQSIRYEERKIALEGLNTQLGLQNTNSNEFFYREILVEFQDAYGESDTVFSKLVNDFRYEQLRMLALDVRGLAASIGAQDMNLLAAEVLKLLLFKKYEILQDFIPLYTKALQKLNYSIDTYLSK
jgi:CheY-like chemotaxis protein